MIGVMMFWLLIFASEMMVTNATSFNPTGLTGTVNVTVTSGSNFMSTIFTYLTNLGGYIKAIIQALLLYEPSVFAGNYIWFWYFICLPIDIGMLFSIVSMLRGSSSS
jgi:hypothetical protein